MADMRISGGQLPPTAAPQRSDAARAAQRAFFQAALQPAAPTAPVRTATAPSPAPRPTPSVNRIAEAAPEPSRYARPGSVLDIKV